MTPLYSVTLWTVGCLLVHLCNLLAVMRSWNLHISAGYCIAFRRCFLFLFSFIHWSWPEHCCRFRMTSHWFDSRGWDEHSFTIEVDFCCQRLTGERLKGHNCPPPFNGLSSPKFSSSTFVMEENCVAKVYYGPNVFPVPYVKALQETQNNDPLQWAGRILSHPPLNSWQKGCCYVYSGSNTSHIRQRMALHRSNSVYSVVKTSRIAWHICVHYVFQTACT